ncbi:hypothetical protein AVEN_245041-1 [Araneus ventricosus]|uniref:Integrase p58-like C-terminal domain-containing protein n=1 Tax=Araneus ventricosus TaxID=182803 RepID=A0A4Y2E7P7_ARAVE|nr:hypothetical protein AVEN_245041-1 [Araneus ventricosus]
MKTRYDSGETGRHFKEGYQVWMYNQKRRSGLSPKLQQIWEGPYTIVKKLNDVIYRVQRSPNASPTKLKEKITIYLKCNVTIAYKEKPFAVAVINPIMKRTDSLKASVEISLLTQASSGDAEKNSIIFMLTHCIPRAASAVLL